MDTDTYSNAGIIEYSNKTLVNVGLRTDKHGELAEKFRVEAIPVTYLLSPDGDRMTTLVGYVGPEDYRKKIEKAVAAHKKLKDLEPRLKAKPDDIDLLKESAGLYADMGDSHKAAGTFKRAAGKVSDKKTQGELLIQAFKHLNELESEDKVNDEILAIAAELDKIDADGKLGFKDDAAYARAMVDFNKEDWDVAIKKLEEIVAKWPDGDRAPMALLNLGDLYHHVKKDNAKAEKLLKQILEKYPKSEVVDAAKRFLQHMKEHKD